MEGVGRVTEADSAEQPADSDDVGWILDYRAWRRGRLQRVQDSARVWLGVLTTLLGLLGSVVLFKGGDLVTGVTRNGWFQFFLVLLVGLVFVSAMLALVAGGSATWGGLGDIAPLDEDGKAAEAAAAGQPVPSPAEDNEPADRRSSRSQIWFAFWLRFSGESPDERRRLLALPPRSRRPVTGEESWERYKSGSVNSADRKRAYLHASRGLGVATALLIAMLAILAVIAGTISPVPTEVIVIHGGRATCIAAADSGKLANVSQVIPVSGC
jgi:hypothetical protein